MHAPFNTTCDVVMGPGTATPGLVLFSCPCRVVPEVRQIPDTSPVNERVAYITMDGGAPVGPLVGGGPVTYSSDYNWSDRIAVPSGNVPEYEVLFTEEVIPPTIPLYWRAHVRLVTDLPFLAQETGDALLQESLSRIYVT